MKRLIPILLLACSLTAMAGGLKVMSYNIRNCKGMDGNVDYTRVADVINAHKPDVVMLQEVDSATVRYGGAVVSDTLAMACGYVSTYAPAINFQGGKYGVALLTRHKPLSVRQYALPGREEKRTLVVAEFEHYVLACTHLSLTEQDRIASLPIIIAAARQCDKPFIIAGDFNAKPDEEFIEQFSKYFTIVGDSSISTFPADKPNIKIDYIAVYKNKAGARINGKKYKVINAPMASDHRPIIATLPLQP